MSSNITTYDPANATLLQMRADPVNFPRLKTIDKVAAYAEMRTIVTQAFAYKGNNPDATQINFISCTLVDELLADTKWGAGNISLGEIRKVVKRAVLETDLPAISVATLYKVIMDYVKKEGNELDRQAKILAKQIQASTPAVQAMMDSYAGKMSKSNQVK